MVRLDDVTTRSSYVSGYCAITWRFFRRNPLSLLLLIIPLILLSYGLGDPWHAHQFIPQVFSQNYGLAAVAAPETPPPILLVSAYFPLGKSKHSHYDYYRWISGFVGRITTDIYIFVPPEMEEEIREIRGSLPIHINTSFTSPYDIPPFHGLKQTFEEQHNKDREYDLHVPELYAVWAAKPYFIAEASRNLRAAGKGVSGQNPDDYKYVFWIDAGSMRETHAYAHWPDPAQLETIWTEGSALSGTPKDDLVLIPVEYGMDPSFRNWTEANGPVDMQFSEGSLIGGPPHAMEWWYQFYMTYFLHYMRVGVFVGKDQTLMNFLFLLHPQRFITVWNRDPTAPNFIPPVDTWEAGLGYCGDPWFYYFFWMARAEEQDAMNAMWKRKWHPDGLWHAHNPDPCQPTRVLSMEELIRRTFGTDWKSPAATLEIDTTL